MSTDNEVTKAASNEAIEKRTYTVAEIAYILQIGRSKAYELCNQGFFHTVKIGRSVRIIKASFDEWLNNQQ